MKQTSPLIFVVDDDKVMCGQIADYLKKHAFQTRTFADTKHLLQAIEEENCALVVLDIMMPGEDGLEFCRRLRVASKIPIIFMSALGEIADRVVGLEMGADDYLVKPFSPRELLARIRTLLRRMGDSPESRPVIGYRFAGWKMDPRSRLLINAEGVAGNLSAAEFRLLRIFLEHPHEILTRDNLLKTIQRHTDVPYDRVLDVQISRLRVRLGESAREQHLILTARGDGYILAAAVEKEYAS